MQPEKALKAIELPVFRDAADSWTVVGEHGIYTVLPSRATGELVCNCPCGGFKGNCSHALAVKFSLQAVPRGG